MTNDDNKKKVIDKDRYDERHRFWTEQALNQFGTAANFFFLISLGFLAFLFDRKIISSIFPLKGDSIDFSKLFFVFAVFSTLLSLIVSAITILSRLHDLRLTRHTIWTRKRYYNEYNKPLIDNYIDLKDYRFLYRLENFISTLRDNSYFINDKEVFNPNEIHDKFYKLRLRNLLLAKFSWWAINFQIITLIIALLFYLLSLL